MRIGALVLTCALGAFPLGISAQQAKPDSAAATAAPIPTSLNDTQMLGRRLFQQRCAVCHTESTPGANRYGPILYKELIAGNEDTMREFISNGSKGKMPGFKYGLEAREIDAIVEYLKTVSRPAKRNSPAAGDTNVMD
ncbi:MAG: cytochrome c [Acidobacteriia bacterium]|nr:cytochrome c [Terriglobia bacterium]